MHETEIDEKGETVAAPALHALHALPSLHALPALHAMCGAPSRPEGAIVLVLGRPRAR